MTMKKTISRPKIGFLVHPRDVRDIKKRYRFLRAFPDRLVEALFKKLPPVIASTITGLRNKDGEDVPGLIIGITMTASQMLEDREEALRQMRKALMLAKKKGIKIVALGALTASLSQGGKAFNDIEGISVTTGRAYTVKTIIDYVKRVVNDFNFDKEVSIGIVGAAGSIGWGCFEMLNTLGFKNYYLFDIERKIEKLLGKAAVSSQTQIDHQLSNLKKCKIIITATNAPEALVRSDDLSSGSIILNDAQPSDVANDVYERDDILVVEAGVIATPGIRCNLNMGLAGREETFCCLGEAYVLAYNNMFNSFTLGELDVNLIKTIEDLQGNLDIDTTNYQNKYGYISSEKMSAFKKNLEQHSHGYI